MTPDCKHNNLRAVNPQISKGDGKETIGAPPETQEEPAWCTQCGALWAKLPFGMGWGFLHQRSNTTAPTLGNLLRESGKKPGDLN